MQKHRYLTNDEIKQLVTFTMCNGDDRYKLTYCNDADIEAADAELGYEAQRYKQEIFYAGSPLKDLNITYLKTIIAYVDNRLVRTDSVAKLILARIHPETRPLISKPASTVIDFIMSASRSSDSPYLWILVDYMYARLPLFRDLVHGKIDMQYIVDHMVEEQYNELQLTRGKKWIRRKGMNYDAIIEKMNIKYGYGDEGYRGSRGGLNNTATDTGLMALPQTKAILAIAYERLQKNVIGGLFYGRNNITTNG